MLTSVPIVVVSLALGIGGCAVVSWLLTLLLEARHPPRGTFVTVDGVRLHVVDLAPAVRSADDPAVLLLHGANLCMEDMRMALGDTLARRLRVIIPDRPGQGSSEAGSGPVGLVAYQVALLHGLLDSLSVGPVIVVGHSFGGLIALRYALEHPDDLAGLVLINPTTHPRPGELTRFQRAAQALIGPLLIKTLLLPLSLTMLGRLTSRMFRPEPVPPGYAARSRLALELTPGRFSASLQEYAGLRDQLIELAPRYESVAVPTVIIAGEADPVVPPKIHAEALASAMPRARLVRLAGAGHMAHHRHGDAIAAEIERLTGFNRREVVDQTRRAPGISRDG